MTRDERDNLRRAIDRKRRELLAARPGYGANRKPVEQDPTAYEYPRQVYNVGREVEPRRVPWVDNNGLEG